MLAVIVISFINFIVVNASRYNLQTDGNDVCQTVNLQNDVVLYSSGDNILKICTNGIIYLGNETTLTRLRSTDFVKHEIIVPYYSQMFLKKTMEIDIFTRTENVAFYNILIHNHFINENAFQAREIVSITHKKFMQFVKEPMELVQNYIITDGRSSFLYTLYNASDSSSYNFFKHFIYGTPMAGFSAGDEFRYDIIEEAQFQGAFKEFFASKSNFGQRGSWLYKIGSKATYTAVIQSPNAIPGVNGPVDLNECETYYKCHANAKCCNEAYSYTCKCVDGFYGNGKVCVRKDTDIYLRGKVDGKINGDNIDNADNTIFYQNQAKKLSITVLPLADGPGNILLLLPHIFIPFAYLFAKSNSSEYSNGFDVIGDFFTVTSIIEFLNQSGERLYVQQKMKRVTKTGFFPIETSIYGTTPYFGMMKNVQMDNIKFLFTPSQGTILSKSKSGFSINGKIYEVNIATAIKHHHQTNIIDIPYHELEVEMETSSYSSVRGLQLTLKPKMFFFPDTPLKTTLSPTSPIISTENKVSEFSTTTTMETISNTITYNPEGTAKTTLATATTTKQITTTAATTTTTTTKSTTPTDKSSTTRPHIGKKFKDSSDFLIYTQSGAIKRSSNPYNATDVEYLYTAYGDYLVGLDYDCELQHIYFTDATTGQLNRVDYEGRTVETIISGLNFPEGLAIDKLHLLIYWTDSGDKTINIGSMVYKTKTVLFSEGISNPRGIVVHGKKNLLFWTDWDRKNPRIETSTTLGKDRRIFVDSKHVKAPNCLTFDYDSNRICWTDADEKLISCANLDGVKNVEVIAEKLHHPFGITVSPNEIFWTDWKTNDRIQSINSVDGTMVERPSGQYNDGRLYDIKYVRTCKATELND